MDIKIEPGQKAVVTDINGGEPHIYHNVGLIDWSHAKGSYGINDILDICDQREKQIDYNYRPEKFDLQQFTRDVNEVAKGLQEIGEIDSVTKAAIEDAARDELLSNYEDRNSKESNSSSITDDKTFCLDLIKDFYASLNTDVQKKTINKYTMSACLKNVYLYVKNEIGITITEKEIEKYAKTGSRPFRDASNHQNSLNEHTIKRLTESIKTEFKEHFDIKNK